MSIILAIKMKANTPACFISYDQPNKEVEFRTKSGLVIIAGVKEGTSEEINKLIGANNIVISTTGEVQVIDPVDQNSQSVGSASPTRAGALKIINPLFKF